MTDSPDDLVMIRAAMVLCRSAHSAVGQVRKYTGEPYWTHPIEVAELLREHAPDAPAAAIIAALLHDVVDDTAITLDEIRNQFGPEVAQMVWDLSEHAAPALVPGPEHAVGTSGNTENTENRAARKARERQQIASAGYWSKSIRLADMISNLRSVADHDPAFAKTYFAEKRLLLPHLVDGHPLLLEMATALVESYYSIPR